MVSDIYNDNSAFTFVAILILLDTEDDGSTVLRNLAEYYYVRLNWNVSVAFL
jgi:hypothetical protein